MGVDVSKILETAKQEECLSDLQGLAERVSKIRGSDTEDFLDLIAEFITDKSSRMMWMIINNASPDMQYPAYKGRPTLFTDSGMLNVNPNLTASDYLHTFKEYLKMQAFRTNDWFRMQDEFADRLADELPKFDRIRQPVDAGWEPVPGKKNRVYVYEFGDNRARMSEVNRNTGKIYVEGIENYWFKRSNMCPVGAGDFYEKSLLFYFNLAKQRKTE